MLDDLPVLLAFTGGLLATVNPCGVAMLPAYLSFFLGLEQGDPAERPLVGIGHSLRVGLTVTAGFLVVFGLAWALLAAGIRAMITVVPWAALVVGVVVAALGLWMLSGRPLPVRLPTAGRAAEGRSTGAMLLFGLGYAIASLSGTLPVFLAVVAGTATRSSLGSGLAVFVVYSLGMALPLLALTLALAMGRDAVVARVRALGRVLHRLAGGLLLVAGSYVVAYWGTELAGVTGGRLVESVLAVERGSAHLARLIGQRPLEWGVGLAAVVALTLGVSARARRRAARKEPMR